MEVTEGETSLSIRLHQGRLFDSGLISLRTLLLQTNIATPVIVGHFLPILIFIDKAMSLPLKGFSPVGLACKYGWNGWK